jgi:glucosylglycerate synthase
LVSPEANLRNHPVWASRSDATTFFAEDRLAEVSILTDDFLRELINVGEVDILIGVPTHNDGGTVGQVVQAVRAGLLRYFPRERTAIINADGGSRDGSRELVRAAAISDIQRAANLQALRTLHSISTQYEGEPSRGRALHTILAAAELLRAKACVVISPDSVNLQPEWIEKLLCPVHWENIDLVTPIYCRHKFDGLLVRNLLYPVTRAVYGRRVREPHPAEFAFSARLATHLLGQDVWSQEVGQTGAETYLVIEAITAGFQLAQSFLGPKSRTDQSAADLVGALRQTVGALFWSLQKTFPVQLDLRDSQPVATSGAESEVSAEPMRINRKRLHGAFVRGIADLEPVLSSILAPSTLADLKRMAALPEEQFRYPNQLWARSVYEFAASYRQAVINRDHIVQALAPLYRGRAYTFLVENKDAMADEVETSIEGLCQTFEVLRPYLVEVWDQKK